jgi:hypothetical protein
MSNFDWIGYISAWLKYGGKILETAGSLGDIIRSAFAGIKIPQKTDYEGKT